MDGERSHKKRFLPQQILCSRLFQLSDQNLLFLQWRKHSCRPPYLFLKRQYCRPADVRCSLVLESERSHFCFFMAMQAKTTLEVKGEISPSACVYTSCYWYVGSLIVCLYSLLSFLWKWVASKLKETIWSVRNQVVFNMRFCHSNCSIHKLKRNSYMVCYDLFASLLHGYHVY